MADPSFAFAGSLAQCVEVRIVTVTENAALFQSERRIIQQGIGQFVSERRHFANGVLQRVGQASRLSRLRNRKRDACATFPCAKFDSLNEFPKLTLQRRDLLQRSFQCNEVSRVSRGLAQSS